MSSPPAPDPTDSDPAAVVPPKPWRRWLPLAVVAAIAGIVAIIIAVASGGDDGTKSGTATTVGGSVAPNGSGATIGTSTGPVSSGASSTVASGTGGPTSSSTSTNPAQSSPAATGSPTSAGATTPATPATTATTASTGTTPPATASSPINLGSAANFAALGNTAVISNGSTKLTGQIGASNGPATGFSAADSSTGIVIVDSLTASQAQVATDGGVSELDALTPTKLPSTDLTTQRIGPGTYSAATLGVSGTVTLDAGGDATALFVFKSESTLTVASATRIVLAGGAQSCNVYWRIGSSATFESDSTFVGTVIADESITAASGSDVTGRFIARNGAVTLDRDSIATPTCA